VVYSNNKYSPYDYNKASYLEILQKQNDKKQFWLKRQLIKIIKNLIHFLKKEFLEEIQKHIDPKSHFYSLIKYFTPQVGFESTTKSKSFSIFPKLFLAKMENIQMYTDVIIYKYKIK
jgi:hypothetical protein